MVSYDHRDLLGPLQLGQFQRKIILQVKRNSKWTLIIEQTLSDR